MLALVEGVFDAPEWAMQSVSGDTQTRVVFQSEPIGRVADVQFLHYDCGMPVGEVNTLYSSEGIDYLLSQYDTYSWVQACMMGDTSLAEFEATYDGATYAMRYWVKEISPTRLFSLNLVFPQSEVDEQARYAQMLFPELPDCS
jgi:hypothetical protein